LVAIDVSIWIVSGLMNAKSVNAFHLVPPVPVVHTANYVRDRINVLQKARFKPVLVFDGQRNPAKAGENERRLSARQAIEQQLTTAYEQGTKSMSDINKLRAKATYVREDVLFEVLQMARSEKIRVVGAPFESDHQLHALQVQGIVDYVLSDDSDIPYLGCRSTIMRMSLNGKCCLVERDVLLNETFPKLFEIRRSITLGKMQLFALCLGNDYVERVRGEGKMTTVAKIKSYLNLQTPVERDKFVQDHIALLDGSKMKQKFKVAMELSLHAPVYVVTPNEASVSPRHAFLLGPDSYSVHLRSMDTTSGDEEAGASDFWIFENDDTAGQNL
jgi:exonuclease-1